LKWLIAIGVGCGIAACGRDSEQISCRDLLPASKSHYAALAALVTDTDDPRNCAVCHNGSEPVYGLNLGTPRAAYFTLRDRIDRVYAKIASGEMPQDGASWGEGDLRLLRSWYCRGALDD
jgi:hypothetical protein